MTTAATLPAPIPHAAPLKDMSGLPDYESAVLCAWTVADVEHEDRWIFKLSDAQSKELFDAIRRGRVEGKSLLEYRKEDFDFKLCLPSLGQAFDEVRDGRGMALVKNLPREGVSAEEFELMTWAIGLHFGVARPQDKKSGYINMVKDVGGVYRSPTGRGYSSNAELDFHVDGSDIVLLSCYNQAPVGGMSMCTSSIKAYEVVRAERPDLAAALHTPYPFSRNGEQREDEPAWFLAPLAGVEDGRLFCAWNRNRLENALKMEGVPQLTPTQREAVEYLDEVVRRSDLM